MTEQVTKEIIERVDLLAEKLGATGEHLWEVLIVQGQIEGWRALFMLLAAFASIYILSKKVTPWWKKACDNDLEPLYAICCILYVILFIVFIIVGLCETQYLFNPEYFALQKILGG